jgi:penicillin-binding protein 1A
VDQNGKVLLENKFDHAGSGAPRVIDARNAFIMNSMLKSVIQKGTAAKALQLKRNDLAGKTGTTNDHYDSWFAGYNPKQVAVAWIGFDKPQTLGSSETGASSALPIWIKYMQQALINVPDLDTPMPEGVVTVKVDPTTGRQDPNGIAEYFYNDHRPTEIKLSSPAISAEDHASSAFKQAQHLL